MFKASTSLFLLTTLIFGCHAAAFFATPGVGVPGVTWGAGTKLDFGFPSGFGAGTKSDKPVEDKKKPEKKITAGGLVQLITAGMGAPFLVSFVRFLTFSVAFTFLT